ncbi:MAG: hypothetical protein K9M15_02380 [Candidatus Marinimicrobia bacterium]|nr:hypothetical protein [Candidatus Neomarinimicrobiota bacterium]
MTNSKDARYCPECRREIRPNNLVCFKFMKYSPQTLQLPYFVCWHCNLCYVDKMLIQKAISAWRSSKIFKPKISHKETYKRILEYLNELIIKYYIKRFGYKIAKFNKTPKK